MKNCKVALISINIGRYICFWEKFYETAVQNFLPNMEREFYVFTDHQLDEIKYSNEKNVHVIYQEDLGWPKNTLMRYEMFLRIEDELKEMDYIYFANANSLFITKLEDDILPDEKRLVFVKGVKVFRDKVRRRSFPYEKNPRSTAYVAPEEYSIYVRGGFNGGYAEDFLKMCHVIDENIKKDLQNNIIAIWHDESHITRYAIGRNDVKLLSPGYCYGEQSVDPYVKHILIRKKDNGDIRFGKPDKISIKWKLINFVEKNVTLALIRLKIIKIKD